MFFYGDSMTTELLMKIKSLIEENKIQLFYKWSIWQQKKRHIMERDNYECQECKKEGKLTISQKAKLDVHHKKELKDYPSLALDDDNLETVCVHHHNILDNKININQRKKFINEERW